MAHPAFTVLRPISSSQGIGQNGRAARDYYVLHIAWRLQASFLLPVRIKI